MNRDIWAEFDLDPNLDPINSCSSKLRQALGAKLWLTDVPSPSLPQV